MQEVESQDIANNHPRPKLYGWYCIKCFRLNKLEDEVCQNPRCRKKQKNGIKVWRDVPDSI